MLYLFPNIVYFKSSKISEHLHPLADYAYPTPNNVDGSAPGLQPSGYHTDELHVIDFDKHVWSYLIIFDLSNSPHKALKFTMGGGIAPTKDTKTVVVLGGAYGGMLKART